MRRSSVERAAPLGRPAPDGLIAVCMATFEPDAAVPRAGRLAARPDRRALGLRDQRRRLEPRGASSAIEAAIAGDERFVVFARAGAAGFYRNFERALGAGARRGAS